MVFKRNASYAFPVATTGSRETSGTHERFVINSAEVYHKLCLHHVASGLEELMGEDIESINHDGLTFRHKQHVKTCGVDLERKERRRAGYQGNTHRTGMAFEMCLSQMRGLSWRQSRVKGSVWKYKTIACV